MKIKLKPSACIPTRSTEGSAGYDLRLPEDVVINSGRNLVKLGFFIALDHGFQAEVRPRSGFSIKGIEDKDGNRRDCDVIVGTIDEDYRGICGVILYSREIFPFVLARGTKIAQMVISRYEVVEFEEVDELDDTQRGEGGFGSTGTI